MHAFGCGAVNLLPKRLFHFCGSPLPLKSVCRSPIDPGDTYSFDRLRGDLKHRLGWDARLVSLAALPLKTDGNGESKRIGTRCRVLVS